MKKIKKSCIIILLIILQSYHFIQSIPNAINLNDYPQITSNLPINQIINQDFKSMYVFFGHKSFTYDKTTITYSANQFNNNINLSNNPSTTIMRINTNIIAILCSNNHLSFLDDKGIVISLYKTIFDYLPIRPCDLIEISSYNYYFIYYSLLFGSESIFTEQIIYNPIIKEFMLIQRITSNLFIDFQKCKIISSQNIFSCIVMNQNNISLRWNNIITNISQSINNYYQTDSDPHILLFDPKIFMFTTNAKAITGHTLSWNSITNNMNIDNSVKVLILPLNYTSWDVIIIIEASNYYVFLIVMCQGLQCTIQRFTFAFDIYSKPIMIAIPSADPNDINTRVSLSLHSNTMYSIIISQINTNWLYYSFSQCLAMTEINNGSIPFYLSSKVSTFINYKILFLDNIEYMTLNTGRMLTVNTWYSYNQLIMKFNSQTAAYIQYSLLDTSNLLIEFCHVQIHICNPSCHLCDFYSADNLSQQCTQCKPSQYLSFQSNGNCLSKSECTTMNGFVIEDGVWRCVQSCSANGYWKDALEHKCVTSCAIINYYSVAITKSCVKSCSDIGYNIDVINNTCVRSCGEINSFLDITTNSCVSSCITIGLYMNPHNNKCIKSCSDIGTFLNPITNSCVNLCSDIGLFLNPQNNECVIACSDIGYYLNPQNNACIQACSDIGYYVSPIDNSCIKACNDIAYYYIANKQLCINQCSTIGYYLIPEKKECIKYCSDRGYFLDHNTNECVHQCKSTEILNKITSECLPKELYDKTIDNYVNNIDIYLLDLYHNYPIRIKDEYALTIYNTSIIPKINTIQIIANESPYNVLHLSSVNLGQCEKFLKENYHLDQSQPLIIAKFDTLSTKQISNVVDFKVFSMKGDLLNISLCYNNNLDITIATPINDLKNIDYNKGQKYYSKGVNAFNSSDEFFNDLCYPFTSEYYTDIPLVKRINDIFIDQSILCNSSCKYASINYQKNSVICSCSNNKDTSYNDTKNELIDKSSTIWITSNIGVVKCYNLVFTKKNFSRNIGSLFMMVLIFSELISAIYFFTVGYKEIKYTLWKITPSKKKKPLQQNELEIISMKKEENGKNHDNNNLALPLSNEVISQYIEHISSCTPLNNANANLHQKNIILFGSTNCNYSIENMKKNTEDIIFFNNHFQSKHKDEKKKQSQLNINKQINRKDTKGKTFDFKKSAIKQSKSNGLRIKRKIFSSMINEEDNNNKTLRSIKKAQSQRLLQVINNLNEYESNTDLIIQFNRENFIFFYLLFLQHVHMFIRSFFAYDKHKTRSTTISLLFFTISLSFTLNALFFSEKYVTKSYETQGTINFLYNIPKMMYSFILSFLFKLIFNILSSIASAITQLTHKMNGRDKRKVIVKRFIWKLSIFYCLKFIILIGFWYYVAAFCAVYSNIQITWLASSLTSCLLDMIVPFIIAGGLTIVLLISFKYKIAFLIKIANTFVVH